MTYATLNPRNVRLIDVVPFCNGFLRVGAGNDVGYLLGCKSAIPMVNSVMMPTFFSGIRIVFGFGSNAQMCGVDTRRVVANVHDNLALRDRADKVFIRIPVSAYLLFAWKKKDSITKTIVRSSPFPASISFFKSIFKHIGGNKRWMGSMRLSGVESAIASAAQFSRNRFFMTTNRAKKRRFSSVSHKGSLVTRLYLMPSSWEILL